MGLGSPAAAAERRRARREISMFPKVYLRLGDDVGAAGGFGGCGRDCGGACGVVGIDLYPCFAGGLFDGAIGGGAVGVLERCFAGERSGGLCFCGLFRGRFGLRFCFGRAGRVVFALFVGFGTGSWAGTAVGGGDTGGSAWAGACMGVVGEPSAGVL